MASGEEEKLRAALAALADADTSGGAADTNTAGSALPEPEPEPELELSGDLLEDFFGGEQLSPYVSHSEASAGAAAQGAAAVVALGASDVDPWVLLSPTEQLPPQLQPPQSGEGDDGLVIVSEAADILADFFGSCRSRSIFFQLLRLSLLMPGDANDPPLAS
jgi:hypothetical protein